MAINKNIQMTEFNGIDYDILYPQTIANQVKDLDVASSKVKNISTGDLGYVQAYEVGLTHEQYNFPTTFTSTHDLYSPELFYFYGYWIFICFYPHTDRKVHIRIELYEPRNSVALHFLDIQGEAETTSSYRDYYIDVSCCPFTDDCFVVWCRQVFIGVIQVKNNKLINFHKASFSISTYSTQSAYSFLMTESRNCTEYQSTTYDSKQTLALYINGSWKQVTTLARNYWSRPVGCVGDVVYFLRTGQQANDSNIYIDKYDTTTYSYTQAVMTISHPNAIVNCSTPCFSSDGHKIYLNVSYKDTSTNKYKYCAIPLIIDLNNFSSNISDVFASNLTTGGGDVQFLWKGRYIFSYISSLNSALKYDTINKTYEISPVDIPTYGTLINPLGNFNSFQIVNYIGNYVPVYGGCLLNPKNMEGCYMLYKKKKYIAQGTNSSSSLETTSRNMVWTFNEWYPACVVRTMISDTISDNDIIFGPRSGAYSNTIKYPPEYTPEYNHSFFINPSYATLNNFIKEGL